MDLCFIAVEISIVTEVFHEVGDRSFQEGQTCESVKYNTGSLKQERILFSSRAQSRSFRTHVTFKHTFLGLIRKIVIKGN